ncbi:MAG TPA: RsmB/NOP family class I SAM-dependent RNA methyltransferase [Isosphaeraceae bacterium]|nr:RsmB/NOP family class I SAM-dependent RNA methyltransferase [Isosphaeraceae bacterium]
MKRSHRQATIRPTFAAAAEQAAAIAPTVLHAVLSQRHRLSTAISRALQERTIRGARAQDRAAITRSLRALLRWWGWIEPLRLRRPEEQLLLAALLDLPELSALGRVWAERIGRPVDRLVPVGDAPSWTARAEGLKRWLDGRPANADPWRLFPAWLRDQLPVPPGDETPKARRLDFLASLQRPPPTWVAVRGHDEKAAWAQLRNAGLKPWVHRRIASAAKLPPETDLTRVEAFGSGRLVVQDLASQAVGIVCDPDPGERWWVVRGEADGGLPALHLAALMAGKGVVVATCPTERQRHETALRLRRGPFHNITTKVWDGRHPIGKPAGFDGVLLDAPCSGVGGWRRHPDARWTLSAEEIPQLAARQVQALEAASSRVRPGGILVYTVLTVTRPETLAAVDAFLRGHPEFQLQPFPHPLEDTTTGGTLQIWPQLHDCDGRFIARLIRT